MSSVSLLPGRIYHLRFPKLNSITISNLNTFLKKLNITKFFEDENNFWVSKIQEEPKTFPEVSWPRRLCCPFVYGGRAWQVHGPGRRQGKAEDEQQGQMWLLMRVHLTGQQQECPLTQLGRGL